MLKNKRFFIGIDGSMNNFLHGIFPLQNWFFKMFFFHTKKNIILRTVH